MPQPIQPVQVAPVNPSQAAAAPARALPPQPLASQSSLQSLASSDKGCLRRTWDSFISILESIYAYCLCRRSSTPPPAANPPSPAAIPVSNPVNLVQRQPVQQPQAPQSVQESQAQQAPAAIENSEVLDVESGSDDDEDFGPILSLRESHEIAKQLFDELRPDRLEDLVESVRWREIQGLMDQLDRRVSSPKLATSLLKDNLRRLKILISAAREWERYLEEEEDDVEPFRGNIHSLRTLAECREILPSILSRAREELRKSPADIDRDFLVGLLNMDTVNRLEGLDEFRELLDTREAARDLSDQHWAHFFERGDPAIFTPAADYLNQQIEKFSPDRIEATLNSPEYRGLETGIILERMFERMDNLIPRNYKPQFDFAFGDRFEILVFLIGQLDPWQEHLRNPSAAAPFRGRRDIDIESMDTEQRAELRQGLLEAAKEQVRTPPEQINLARLSSLKSIVERYKNMAGQRAFSEEFVKIEEMIRAAKGLKELHNEGIFQRNAS